MHWDYGWGWGMGLGWLLMAAFWILIILGIVYLIKMIGGSKKEERGETALDILKKRYAKGEITKEEYDRIRDDLLKN